MDWSNATWWWIATGMLVAAELATGTFYLLMLALGTAAGAVAASMGAAPVGQAICTALVGGGAVAGWHLYRRRQPAAPPAELNPDLNMDIGGHVMVAAWSPEGQARVFYRGAGWDARYGGSGTPAPGEHRIARIDGNQLVLERPAAP